MVFSRSLLNKFSTLFLYAFNTDIGGTDSGKPCIWFRFNVGTAEPELYCSKKNCCGLKEENSVKCKRCIAWKKNK